MRIFGKVNGEIDRFDRAPWMTPPFDLSLVEPPDILTALDHNTQSGTDLDHGVEIDLDLDHDVSFAPDLVHTVTIERRE